MIINMATQPDSIKIIKNHSRLIAYARYGNITHRLLVKMVAEGKYKMVAVNPTVY